MVVRPINPRNRFSNSIQKKILFTIIALPIIILLAIILWVYWPYSDKEIRHEIDRFNPPADWQLMSEAYNAPKSICYDMAGCPSASRTWKLSKPLTCNGLNDEFRENSIETNITSGNPDRAATCGLTAEGVFRWDVTQLSEGSISDDYKVIVYVKKSD